MKIVMVGGSTRNIGKTSVVEGLIGATADLNWTAVKITQFGHGVCSGDCETCDCAVNVDQFSITEERSRNTGSDTSRFLAAGARRSLWVRSKQGELYTALPAFRKEIEKDGFVIVESNSLRNSIEPAVYLQVLDPSNSDFKSSARQFFDLCDAYVVVNKADSNGSVSRDASLTNQIQKKKPWFTVTKEDRFISAPVIEFVITMLKVGNRGLTE